MIFPTWAIQKYQLHHPKFLLPIPTSSEIWITDMRPTDNHGPENVIQSEIGSIINRPRTNYYVFFFFFISIEVLLKT